MPHLGAWGARPTPAEPPAPSWRLAPRGAAPTRRLPYAVAALVVLAGCGRIPGAPAVASSVAGASSSATVMAPPRPVSGDMGTTMHGSVTGTPPPALSGGLAFATAQDGLAALNAGGVLGTSDGGRSWSVLDPGGPRFQYLAYPAAARAYGLTSDHVLWTTADGGQTWTEVRGFTPSTAAFSQGLGFTSADAGWVAVGETLYTTADGGATWDQVVAPASAASVMGSGYARDLVFVSHHVGYLSAERGGVFRTENDGRTFQQLLRSDGADEMAWPSAAVGYVAAAVSGSVAHRVGGLHRTRGRHRARHELGPAGRDGYGRRGPHLGDGGTGARHAVGPSAVGGRLGIR